MGLMGCPETSARHDHSALRKIAKEGRSHFLELLYDEESAGSRRISRLRGKEPVLEEGFITCEDLINGRRVPLSLCTLYNGNLNGN
jgi:hypothetical protein